MTHDRQPIRLALLALALAVSGTASDAFAQVMDVRPVTPPVVGPSTEALRTAQRGFEDFRRDHLPFWSSRRPTPNSCDEQVGRFCYWYDELEEPPPPEPAVIAGARDRLIAQLDSAGAANPADHWVAGQRVRYMTEAGRFDDAIAAARECTSREWWCFALRGFALHVAGHYAAADSEYSGALALMGTRQACDWRDIKLLLDDVTLRRYRALSCADRATMEKRIWSLSRRMLSANGNDSRTEFYSRLMMARFLEDAPSVSEEEFDTDERELLIRYGWPRAWSLQPGYTVLGARGPVVVGHEPQPAPPYLPPPDVLENPASSDSAGWRGKGLPGVRSRYAADYAAHLLPLEHQAALLRRGDSAVVVVAWSLGADSALATAARADTGFSAALVVVGEDDTTMTIVRAPHPDPSRGTFLATAPWRSMLMSTEVEVPSRKTLVRARYGLRGSDALNSRVQVSDVVLFDPYDGMPARLEDVLPHMRTSERLVAGSKLGIYWESYNTNPKGEGLGVHITVAPENPGGGWLQRALTALRLQSEAKPVSVGISDVSARGLTYSPRSVVVDLSTLKPGRYDMELEIDAGEGNVVHASRVISVVAAP